jgi:hypothetical protein
MGTGPTANLPILAPSFFLFTFYFSLFTLKYIIPKADIIKPADR